MTSMNPPDAGSSLTSTDPPGAGNAMTSMDPPVAGNAMTSMDPPVAGNAMTSMDPPVAENALHSRTPHRGNGAANLMTPPYVSARPLARGVTALLVASVAFAWVTVGFDWADVTLIARKAAGGFIPPDAEAGHEFVGRALRVGQAVLFGSTAVLFLLWIYSARSNVRALGARRLDYTTSWSVSGFFVPVLNLLRPYQVLREIAKASDPSVRDPLAWRTVRTPWLLRLWWPCCLLWGALAVVAVVTALTTNNVLAKEQMASLFALATDAAAAICGSLAFFLVTGITDAQEEKRALLAGEPPGYAGAGGSTLDTMPAETTATLASSASPVP